MPFMELNHVERAENIALSRIFTLPGGNPFAGVSAESLRPLLDSIRKDGVQRPVMLAKREEGGYYLIDGYRRCCAAYLAHMDTVPAHIRELTLQEAYEARVAANRSCHPESDKDRPTPQMQEAHSLVAVIKKVFGRGPKQNREKHRRRGR